MNARDLLTIGDLARRTGISVSAIRFYEERGLVQSLRTADAIGLTVPDMPYGSPGMGDMADAEPYDVLLVRRDGSTEVYASYR